MSFFSRELRGILIPALLRLEMHWLVKLTGSAKGQRENGEVEIENGEQGAHDPFDRGTVAISGLKSWRLISRPVLCFL
jgi:hypothetical protein